MGDNNITVDGEDYKSSLKFGQSPSNQQRTQVDENRLDNSYLNNSLVFGNEEPRKYSNGKDVNFEYAHENKDMDITFDGADSTQNDASIRLQNSPVETPFLNKLKDPFEETEELSKSEMSTPYSYKVNDKKYADVNSIKLAIGQKYKTFNSPSDFGIRFTQGDRTNHTFNILNRDDQYMDTQLADTQLINKDNQIFNKDTELSNKDTQIINKDTRIINKDTQIIDKDDTQIINHNTQVINNDTQVIHNVSQGFDKQIQIVNNDTQFIGKESKRNNGYFNLHNGTQLISLFDQNSHNGEQKTSTIETPTQAKIIGSAVQIPSTIEVKVKSHREVINTQEETDASYSNGTSPYSQRREVNTEEIGEEEVKTDEETNAYILSSNAEIPYDDSLLTYKIHKRKASVEYLPTSSPKSIKFPKMENIQYSNDEEPNSLEKSHNNMKGPIIVDSPNEIEESSPVLVKRSDLLKIISKSSPLKNDNFNSDVSSVIEKSYILSSPNKLENKTGNKQNVINDINRIRETKSDITTDETTFICDEIVSGSEDVAIVHAKKVKRTPLNSSSQDENFVLRNEDDSTKNNVNKFPESVWASFNLKMFTGRIQKPGKEFSIVEFEEGVYEIRNDNLFLLDIRIGDTIRIKSSSSQYIITGLACRRSEECIRCIRGYDTLLLKKIGKKNHKSEEISVDLDRCYMEISDWVKHQQRMERTSDLEKLSSTVDFRSDALETPKRGTRHYLLPTTDETHRTRLGPFSSPVKVNGNLIPEADTGNNEIFARKAFCITSIDGDRKKNLAKLIKDNGGVVIDDGISDIVEFICSENDHLALKSEKYKDLDFFAMISNSCCRSAKYLQALALGWPILSDTFIFNCIKNRDEIMNWCVYVLPAGHSNYLNTMKSLETYQFRRNYENNLKLSGQWRINARLLEYYKIIVFKPKLNQITLETCKFIFHAFGAKSLIFCDTLKDLKSSFKSMGNDKIIIYDDGEEVKNNLTEIQKKTPGLEMVNKQRKKLRSRTTRASIRAAQKEQDAKEASLKIGLVDWEWVVQCTISTYIWDPDYITVKLT